MTYQQYEKEVFDWFYTQFQKDSKNTFSLRQKANKGAELDYFIGTAKSKYFGTTLWNVPVAYPGSSSDLINIIFTENAGTFRYYIQFVQTKKPHNKQNKFALDLIVALKPKLKSTFANVEETDKENKMEYFNFASKKPHYKMVDDMMQDLKADIDVIVPLIEKEINILKQKDSEFIAERITSEHFNKMYERMLRRFEKYKNNELEYDNEEERIVTKEELINNIKAIPLNQILYGPPGTGKTYNTVNKALEILGYDIENKSRAEIKEIFDEHIKDGQVVFTTFHQSMSYEDFIEGIKPLEPSQDENFIRYDIVQGIFKNICDSARTIEAIQGDVDFDNAKFYKMSLGGKNRLDTHEWCISNDVIALGWGANDDMSALKSFSDWNSFKQKFNILYPELAKESRFNIQASYAFLNMKIGDVVIVSKGNHIIDAIGIIKGTYYFDDNTPLDYVHFRKVDWVATNMNVSPDRFLLKKISQMSIYEFYPQDVKKEAFKHLTVKNQKDINKPYVLIIDEINRGNVSQIFGELITLIEEDKRQGQSEAQQVLLPYSKTLFSVPNNLHLIGTMNTADRSVEAIDTALRRRFVFEEMMPNNNLLKPSVMLHRLWKKYKDLGWENPLWLKIESNFFKLFNVEMLDRGKYEQLEAEFVFSDTSIDFEDCLAFNGLDLSTMLNTINSRIEKLIGKDYQIGHAFFMNIESKEDLDSVFEQKIIPLFQEYFYADLGKIGLVLGESFIGLDTSKIELAKFSYIDGDVKSDYQNRKTFRFTEKYYWDYNSIYSNTNE